MLKMASNFYFFCFMFVGFAFKDEEDGKQSTFLDIGCELASLFVLFCSP
jgi:hypothetical protein